MDPGFRRDDDEARPTVRLLDDGDADSRCAKVAGTQPGNCTPLPQQVIDHLLRQCLGRVADGFQL